MDPEIEEIIKKQMEKLPIEVRRLLANPELNNKIINIGKKNGLDEEQLGILQIETNLVMLGLVHLDEYQNELKSRIKIPDEKINNIINATKEQILNNIQEKLKEFYQQTDNIEGQDQVGEKLDARFDKVPEEIKKIIIQSNYYETLYNIAKTNKITTELMGILEGITTNVITGVIHGDKFEEKIKEKLVLSNEEARKISNEINDKILKPIREKMEKVYNRPQNTTYDIKPVEIKPVRDSGLNNATDNTEKQREPISNGIKIIRPARNAFGTADAGGPKINAMELEDGKENIEIPAHNIGESVPEEKSILAQKLDSSVKNTTTETDHSLKNLPSSATQNKIINNKDPYREIPE